LHALYPVLLDRSQLHKAWPLVRLASPDASLGDWLDYGRKQVKGGTLPRRGLFALSCERGYLYGIAAFERIGQVRKGTTLEVKVLAQAAIAHAEEPMATMTEAMLRLGRLMGCQKIRLKEPELAHWISAEALLKCGFDRADDGFERSLVLAAGNFCGLAPLS